MKLIGVILDFMNEDYRAKIDAAAAQYGYATRYYASSAEAVGQVDDCEILFGHCSGSVLRSAKNLRWYCCCWAGVNRVCDEKLYNRPDCILSNSSGAYGTTIAEHLIMVCLMLLRRQTEYAELIRSGGWDVLPGGIRSLHGSRVTLLGTGDIGTNFAQRLRMFAPAKITGVRRSAAAAVAPYDAMLTIEQLDSVLPQTDLLVMSLPSTAATAGILTRERIALLPKTSFVINVGRGDAVDQTALMEALNEGRLAGAALDVVEPEPLPADHPLRNTKNLLLTPHVAGNMTLGYTCDLIVSQFLEDLENYTNGRPLTRFVDRRRGY